MKYLLSILILLCSIDALCQVQIKGRILNAETGEPIPELTFYLHKNHDKWIDIGKTNTGGYFSARLQPQELDSASKYQIFINETGYKLAETEIDIHKAETIIKLLPNKNESGSNYCPVPSMGFYAPHTITSLDELPDSIQLKLTGYLLNRLGSAFYNRVRFKIGNIIDIRRLHKIEPNSLNYRWTVHNYYLCFAVSDTLGASIAMDSTGRVTEKWGFPEIAKDPSKENIINEYQAIKIAKKNKVYDKKTTAVSFGYDSRNDCFEWIFKNCIYKGLFVNCSLLHIAAHTGQVLRTSKTSGKRSFF